MYVGVIKWVMNRLTDEWDLQLWNLWYAVSGGTTKNKNAFKSLNAVPSCLEHAQ
jgi:hypothetical protein